MHKIIFMVQEKHTETKSIFCECHSFYESLKNFEITADSVNHQPYLVHESWHWTPLAITIRLEMEYNIPNYIFICKTTWNNEFFHGLVRGHSGVPGVHHVAPLLLQ